MLVIRLELQRALVRLGRGSELATVFQHLAGWLEIHPGIAKQAVKEHLV